MNKMLQIISLLILYVVSGFESQIYYVEEGEPIDTMFVVNLKGETNFRRLIRGTITATAGGGAGIYTSHIYSIICFLSYFILLQIHQISIH